MVRKNNRTGKRLRILPLIIGIYGLFLGFGLIMMGLVEIREGIGLLRLLIGLGMACFGLLGIWDGVRDLLKPEKKAERQQTRQFILIDASGTRSSNVTPELLRKQMGILAESEEHKCFELQILPPLPAREYGMLRQVSCVYQEHIILAATFEMPENGYRQMYHKSVAPDIAEGWLRQLLAGSPDFSGWKNIETNARWDEEDIQWNHEEVNLEETDTKQDAQTFFLAQLREGQKGRQMICRHQLLVVFGESWRDEHRFFSAGDVELVVEGIYEGRYQKAVLEWGTRAVDLFRGIQNEIMVIWRTDNTVEGNTRFWAREGTVTQVKFWLVRYMERGFFEEMGGWADITAQIEKQRGKGEKKHGKVF